MWCDRDEVLVVIEETGFGGGDGLALFHPGAVGFDVGFGGTGEGLDDSGVGVESVVCCTHRSVWC